MSAPIVDRLQDYSVCERPLRDEAADTITDLLLAGMAVWNNVLNGDIEASTPEAARSLSLLHAAIAKAKGDYAECGLCGGSFDDERHVYLSGDCPTEYAR
jgi:hypothetical protein